MSLRAQSTLSRRVSAIALSTVSIAAWTLAGCGRAGNPALPADPTAQSALDRSGDGACSDVGSFGEPLVVDWEAHKRADIEEAMHDGVAVVSYDCKTLRLVHGCSVDGEYGFLGVSRKEEVVQFENESELRVNLPSFGGVLAKDFGAELQRGSTLDVAMVLIGKKRTTLRRVARDALKGGTACSSATHFIRGAFVGAFALNLGTRGKVSVAASVFGSASTGASKLAKYRDGQPEACTQLPPDANAASPACAAVVRLELVGLDAPAPAPEKAAQIDAETLACPTGMVRSGGKCTPNASTPHLCKEDDRDDCAEQCSRGDNASCWRLGTIYKDGKTVAKDEARAAKLFKQACDADYAFACNSLGILYGYGGGVPKDDAQGAALFRRACEAGDSVACANLALHYRLGIGVPKDMKESAALYRRACDAGSTAGCIGLGVCYADGDGVAKDEARAMSLYKRACDAGEAQGCGNLGFMHENGRGAPADRGAAVRLYRQACKLGKQDTSCDSQGCKTGLQWPCDALKRLGESE